MIQKNRNGCEFLDSSMYDAFVWLAQALWKMLVLCAVVWSKMLDA
jgi:hypothetical protein